MISLLWVSLVADFCRKGSWAGVGIGGEMVVDELAFGSWVS